MAGTIHILDENISALIAAGEVVERPQSVVKELVENSVDAGAKKITVEIENGGVSLIKVSDDGCGMSREDAELSFVKHATSKIKDKYDLYNINTLGFRGEALASICAVSNFEMLTKTADSLSAYKIIIDGGVQKPTQETAAPDGTTISVKNLFYNTPARLKFLKSEQTENGAVSTLMERLALSHPDISFRLTVNGREVLFTSGNGRLSDVVFSIFGKDFADMCLEVDYSGKISIKGFTGKPLLSKPNRNFQIFFVNGRLVRSRLLQSALEAAYKNSMLISRYPVCVLFLSINSTEIDINVHPSKQEIKFSDEVCVRHALLQALDKALMKDSGIAQIIPSEEPVVYMPPMPKRYEPQANLTADKPFVNESLDVNIKPAQNHYQQRSITENIEVKPATKQSVKEYEDWKIISEVPKEQIIGSITDMIDVSHGLRVADAVTVEKPLEECSDRNSVLQDKKVDYEQQKVDDKVDFTLIGEAFLTYIILQKENNILFIDKHALHERMNFEKLKARKSECQTLLTPLTVSLGTEECVKIIENKVTLETLGFDVDDFGDGTLIVRQIPQLLSVDDVEYLLNKFANGVCSAKSTYDEFLYDIACKASVKSGMQTSQSELNKLVETYLRNENTLKYCPHGRPVCFSLSKTALEKQFKRIV